MNKKINLDLDILFVAFIFAVGGVFLWDIQKWAGITLIGSSQYGDAAFWWSGGLHVAEGVFKDNPNVDFRMGYALFSGVFISLFGSDFWFFHKILVILFLFSVTALYFAIKPAFGRMVSAGVATLLIVNPYSAEWLSISTSDSLGLIFNILAISSLVVGLRYKYKLNYIFLSGILISLGGITRPLMAPFIIVALAIVFNSLRITIKSRLQATTLLMLAFAIPVFLWMVALHNITGSWALAGHDSTAIYAASDPEMQVWNGAMYEKVADSAKQRYQVQSVTAAQLNSEFWNLAAINYKNNIGYHIGRIVPHVWDIAEFSNKFMARNTERLDLIRKLILEFVVIGLAISAAKRGKWLGSILVTVSGLLILLYPTIPIVITLIGAILFLVPPLCARYDKAYTIIAAYWWVGVAVLFFVGGTFGPPLGAVHALNALGYRLGFQFFFVNDVILLAMLGQMSSIGEYKNRTCKCNKSANQDLLGRSRLDVIPAPILKGARLFLFGLASIMIAGSLVVGYRVWTRAYLVPKIYPAVGDLNSWWAKHDGAYAAINKLQIAHDVDEIRAAASQYSLGVNASPYIAFSGKISDFIWNLLGQNRSQAIIYFQKNIVPDTMHPNHLYVEFPQQLNEDQWRGRRGLWIARRFPDNPRKSNLPFYFSEISIKAYIPLASDGANYDYDNAEIFPIQRYASQLYSSGELRVQEGLLRWEDNSTDEKFPRAFSVMRNSKTGTDDSIKLKLDISRAKGNRNLSFNWQIKGQTTADCCSHITSLKIFTSDGKVLFDSKLNEAEHEEGLVKVNLNLADSDNSIFEIVVNGIGSERRALFYEFNLLSDDYVQK